MEVWRQIPGMDGYEVSDTGRVRSVDRVIQRSDGKSLALKGRELVLHLTTRGYPAAHIHGRSYKTAYLVLLAFVGPRPAGQVCRHLNDIKTDNRLENLAYGTQSENNRDAIANGHHQKANRTHCPYGHPYSGENLIVRPGRRGCRECARFKERRNYWRKQGVEIPPQPRVFAASG